jgi:hypothetical protein
MPLTTLEIILEGLDRMRAERSTEEQPIGQCLVDDDEVEAQRMADEMYDALADALDEDI